jgi:hypothetical protein
MVTFFCPACWEEVALEARICVACGADLTALDGSLGDRPRRGPARPTTPLNPLGPSPIVGLQAAMEFARTPAPGR